MQLIQVNNSFKFLLKIIQFLMIFVGVVGTDIFKNTISFSLTKNALSSWWYKVK